MYRNRRFIDIAINLTDCVFFGVDRKGKKIHESDIDLVIERAIKSGVDRMIITGTDLEVSSKAIAMCRQYPGKCFCTVGIHPAHSDDFVNEATKQSILASLPSKKSMNKNKKSQQAPAGTGNSNTTAAAAAPTTTIQPALDQTIATNIISQLREMVTKNRDVVVAIGECGLDYAELSPYVTPSLQAEGFQLQAKLAKELNIPLLLHSRDCGMDFVKEMKVAFPDDYDDTNDDKKKTLMMMRGITHSFNGSSEELTALLQMKSIKNYFGVNASAFRDETVAKAVAQMIPEDRLMIETDAPWCSPKLGDWGYVAADRLVLKEANHDNAIEQKKKFLVEEEENTNDSSSIQNYNIPPLVDKLKFEMGKRVDKRNEPCTLPAVFAQLLYAKGLLGEEQENENTGTDEESRKKKKEELLKKGDELAARIYQNVLDSFSFVEVKKKNDGNDDNDE